MMDVMFAAFDEMKVLLQQVIDQCLEAVDLDTLVEQLKAISDGTFDTGEPAPEKATAKTEEIADRPEEQAPQADASHPVFAEDLREIVESFVDEIHRLQQVIDQCLEAVDLDTLVEQLKAISDGTFDTGEPAPEKATAKTEEIADRPEEQAPQADASHPVFAVGRRSIFTPR